MDSIGRKKVLIVALLIFAVSTVAYAFSSSYLSLLVIRFVQGIGFGIATTATGAIAADLIPDSRRGEGMGYYALFMTLAMVFGPYLGLTVIQHASFSMLFFLCALFAATSLILASAIGLPGARHDKVIKKGPFSLSSIIEKSALPISITASFIGFSYSSILSYVSLYAESIGLTSIAGLFFIVFASVIILSRPFTGKWFDLYGENRIVYPALMLFLAGIFILSFPVNGFFYLLAAAIIGLGYGAAIPSFQTISIKHAAPERRGMATATYFIFFDIGVGLGSFMNSLFSANFGYERMFLIGSGFILISLVCYYYLYGRTTKEQKAYSFNGSIPAEK
ncbi:MAG: MFS transporter [Bacillus sp. (in: firmicutes)]